ncbi:MAG TPA: Fe-S cluster assembly protein SufD [Stellaceae bacterium]|jgi:Fe-S cluster assembly protein SufD|nr:Fe-S cluster assembly protein SufD [Stellaceae bacterium]
MTIVKAETVPYIEAFRAQAQAGEPDWLTAGREAALARFGSLGFPTRRQEAWRFTDLRPLQRQAFPPAAGGATVSPDALRRYRLDPAAHSLVLVNGRFAPELSRTGALPAGAWLASTRRTLEERPHLLEATIAETDIAGAQPFAALNAAFFADGVVLALDAGVVLEEPIQIIHLASAAEPRSFHLRSVIALGAGSRATIIESFIGDGAAWTNAVTAVTIGEGAALEHAVLQDESRAAIHFSLLRGTLAAGAAYESFALTLGARLSRRDAQVTIAGPDARCTLNGAYLLRGDQEATNATFVDHAAPGGTTRELWKGVADGRAHGAFLGRIAVRPDAQKTDASQVNRNLLLSPRASIDTKPELEILADDVKCSHGATVGDLDADALFYLRARGIAEAEARRMLIDAFAAEAIATVANPALRDHLLTELQRWLGAEEAVPS